MSSNAADAILEYVGAVVVGLTGPELQALEGLGAAVEKLIADAISGANPAPDAIQAAEKAADVAEDEKFKE